MGELMGKGRLNPDGNMGFAAILSFSSSASCSLLALALRFWNQILTWVSVRLRELENSALSAMDRYCFWRNLRSRASSCEVVNGVRGFLLVLCFLRVQAVGLRCPARKGEAGYDSTGTARGSAGMLLLVGVLGIPSQSGILLQRALQILPWPNLNSLQLMGWEGKCRLSDFKRDRGFPLGVTSQGLGAYKLQESTAQTPQKQEIPERTVEQKQKPCSRISPQVTAEGGLTIFVVSLTGHFSLLFLFPNQAFPLLINFDFR